MKIYDIDNVRSKVILDIEEYQSIDHYLFKNPYLKRLVYSYLKESPEQIELSKLDELFSKTIDLSYYDSDEHFVRMANNQLYRKMYNSYIINPNSWVHGSMQAQSYFFDAKNLLKGEYQEKISKVVDLAIRSISMHYSVSAAGIHQTPKHQEFYQQWFDKKKSIEDDFFNKMFEENILDDKEMYKVQRYHNIIEIYDTQTTLTLQFNIQAYTNTVLKVLMPKVSNRSTKDKRNTLVTKFLAKCNYAMKIYQWLISGENITFINDYLTSLEKLQEVPQFKVLHSITRQFLEDIKNKEQSTYIGSEWISLQMCHKNVVERNVIHFSSKTSLLRIYRKVRYIENENSKPISDEYELRPYSIPKNLDRSAKMLLNHGLITFSTNADKLNQKTFEDLSSGKIHTDAKLFMRLPIIDSSYIFNQANDKVEKFNQEIEDSLEKGLIVEYPNTRIETKKHDKTMSTYFETMSYLNDPSEFTNYRNELNHAKLMLTHSYINQNKGLLELVNKIITEEKISA